MTNFTQDYYGSSAPEVIDTQATYAFEEAKKSFSRTHLWRNDAWIDCYNSCGTVHSER